MRINPVNCFFNYKNKQNKISFEGRKKLYNPLSEIRNPDILAISDIIHEDQFIRQSYKIPPECTYLEPEDYFDNLIKNYDEVLHKIDNGKTLIQDDEVADYVDSALRQIPQNYNNLQINPHTKRSIFYSSLNTIKNIINANNELNEEYRTIQYTRLYPNEIFKLALPVKASLSLMEIDRNNPIGNLLYEKYYVTPLHVPKATKEKMIDINKKIGVKTFTTQPYGGEYTLNPVLDELYNWYSLMPQKTKLPHTICVSKLEDGFGAFLTFDNSHIYLDSEMGILYPPSLRHELIHVADCTPEEDVIILDTENSDIKQLPKKTHRTFMSICKDIRNTWENLGFSSPYVRELRNAGVDDFHIEYAHKSKREFIAVAGSAPDTTQYSDNFKLTLLKLGLPAFIINLPPIKFNNFFVRENDINA